MRLFAQYYNTMFVNNLGDDLILANLSGMCNRGDVFLDLCCGSGRALVFPLRQQDVKAVGIDNDPEMLSEADNYLRRLGFSNYELVRANVLDLDYERRFKIATCISNCMSFFRGEAEIQKLLERVHRSLIVGGLFFIESYVPGNPHNGYSRKLTYAVDGGVLTCALKVSDELNDSDGSTIKTFTYDLEIGGRKEQEVYRVSEVYFPRIVEIAREKGFIVDGIYGDSNATAPLDATSVTQSLLLRKK